MKYRRFGKLDFQVSALGFGTMRFPVENENRANVKEDEAIQMMRYAIDNGVNYFDSAYPYHDGKSEEVVGKALQNGYREKVHLVTKMPARMVKKYEDFDRIFNQQLQRLQTDRLDFYLLHGLDKMLWPRMKELKAIDWLEKKVASGQIGHLGFSFHDNYGAFKEIIDEYDGWTLCQIQYNYMDTHFQAGTRGLKYAAGKGLAVVVMEPIRGGSLSKASHPAIASLWESAGVKRTPSEWALLWVWEHPEVSVVLSGMSSMQQVRENLVTADHSGPGVLNPAEMALIEKVKKAYQKLIPVPCTGCRYCIPCPNGVDIPHVFEFYNNAVTFDDPTKFRTMYQGQFAFNPEKRADKCLVCGECLEKCPQKIDIPKELKTAHEYLITSKP
jgi:predicted aldo/keto reductase-like oxidoreductase